jgi:hypothetical protein
MDENRRVTGNHAFEQVRDACHPKLPTTMLIAQ